VFILLLISLNTCSQYNFSEYYDHISEILNNCVPKYIEKNNFDEVNFDFGYNTENGIKLKNLRIYIYFNYGYYYDKNLFPKENEEKLINELYNIFSKEAVDEFKKEDLGIIRDYPFRVDFKKEHNYSDEEIDKIESELYLEIGIPKIKIDKDNGFGYIEIGGINGKEGITIDDIKNFFEKYFGEIKNIEI
jgi:hypothetical protein